VRSSEVVETSADKHRFDFLIDIRCRRYVARADVSGKDARSLKDVLHVGCLCVIGNMMMISQDLKDVTEEAEKQFRCLLTADC
jgi:hypothetical protein